MAFEVVSLLLLLLFAASILKS